MFNVKAFAALGLMTALAIWLLPATSAGHGGACDISGHAFDQTGRPIPSAVVVLRDVAGAPLAHARAGADGAFVFAGRSPGKYRLSTAHGADRGEVVLELGGPATCIVNLHVRPLTP